MMRRWNFRGLAGVIFVAFFVASGILSSTASATGESYIYDKGILYATDAGNFFHIYAASFPNGNEKLQLISLGTQGYPKTSNMEVFYIERKPEHLAQQCGDATSYVEVHVDKSTKKTTVVKAACGRQSEQGTNPVFSGDFSSYNTWSQSVDVQWLGDAAPPPTGPVDITGVATYKFDTAASKTGDKIQACGGFFKQFTDNSDCINFSLSSSSSDTATQPIAGSGPSHIYTAQQSAGPCLLNLEIAISSVDRQMQSGSIPGYIGYRLSKDGADVTSKSQSDTSGCILTRTTDSSSWEQLPGVSIAITGADELDSFLDGPVETGPSASSCTIPGVGWLVCPVVNFLASLADGIHNFLNSFLEVPAATVFDTEEDTYKAWSAMLTYANILFVIAFILIVLSQVTSIGLSNYGIKKLLPKLILVALLVNLSFPITAIAVDLSNILGYRLTEAISKSTLGELSSNGGYWSTPNIFSEFAKPILLTIGAAGAGAIIYFNLAGLIGVLISVVVTGITVAILLVIRQALIIMLIVVSPIAFSSMLLPNTDGIYKKWFFMFKSLLLVFPIVGLLYGSAKLASGILMAVGDKMVEDGNLIGMMLSLIAAALPILVLVTVVSILKKVLDIIDGGANISARLQSGLGKLSGVTSGIKARDARNRKYTGQGIRMRVGRSKALGGLGSRLAYGGAIKDQAIKSRESLASREALDMYATKVSSDTGYTNRLTGGDDKARRRVLSGAENVLTKAKQEEIEFEISRLENIHDTPETQIEEIRVEFEEAIKSNDVVRARAAQKILLSKGNAGITTIHKSIASLEADTTVDTDSSSNKAISGIKTDLNSAGIKGKDAALAKWAYVSSSLQAVRADKETYTALTDAELGGQSIGNINEARKNGALDKERAARMLATDDIAKDLNVDKLSAIRDAEKGIMPSSAPAPTTPKATP